MYLFELTVKVMSFDGLVKICILRRMNAARCKTQDGLKEKDSFDGAEEIIVWRGVWCLVKTPLSVDAELLIIDHRRTRKGFLWYWRLGRRRSFLLISRSKFLKIIKDPHFLAIIARYPRPPRSSYLLSVAAAVM